MHNHYSRGHNPEAVKQAFGISSAPLDVVTPQVDVSTVAWKSHIVVGDVDEELRNTTEPVAD